ncbi:MAG TPA: hypothetical protein VLJ18_10835 [Thermoanaerobaculia bacterium]|nr:hypothetical protein [Thermoanaerobaculia bacterium]
MGTVETPKTPVKAAPKTAPTSAAPTVREGIREGARSVAKGFLLDRNPYLKMAFTNPYNLSLFAGALAAAGITLNPVLAVVALGLEGLWLLHAPDSSRLKHLLWDPKFEKLRNALQAQERAQRLANVGDEERERVNTLVARQEQIRRLAAQNPSFTGDLLRNELVKTDRLVDAFVEMAVTCARYEAYLGSIDTDALEKDRRRYEQAARSGEAADPRTTIAKKNLSIVSRRLEKVQEIRSYLSVARGQLDLIENSFQLIADQIVTMQSPQELSGQLDELLDGVEAIRQTAQDTEKILSGIGIEREM